MHKLWIDYFIYNIQGGITVKKWATHYRLQMREHAKRQNSLLTNLVGSYWISFARIRVYFVSRGESRVCNTNQTTTFYTMYGNSLKRTLSTPVNPMQLLDIY